MGYFNDYMELDCDVYNVPDHIDPSTGKYLPGTRKCSKCKSFKTKKDFNKEQEKKPASKRICNECGPPMPKDLSSFTVSQLKDELKKRGEDDSATKGMKKADLVARLQRVLDDNKDVPTEAAAALPHRAASEGSKKKSCVSTATLPPANDLPLTYEYIQSLKVVDLKKELKARGRPVSGLKAVLQQRLLDAAGISIEAPTVDNAKEVAKNMPTKKTVVAASKKSKTKASATVTVTAGINKENSPTQTVPASNVNVQSKNDAGGLQQEVAQPTTQYFCMPTKTQVHWKKVPPGPGAAEAKQNVHGRTFYWCNKCRMWTPSHSTTQHISNKKKNKQKPNKGPLAPLHGMPRPMYTPYY